ncbi:SigB/SigF/SigG family RNA polymerase sigma factor [Streptacidiphilus jiangxiensis]|uniref:RNA polymerase sigma-B factor n=1 Tax=Streptacidiphilus jiangxiensis TaxID=235985 RepID=A0A1H7NTG1_STRJI|nr:SigB/SigF/SigG family RNA polymerase sigma factor [Streptacidiphilus jiangxiensis]SEL26614.1 RNA polymerase sigma-B factor [Streptacidiphilus jiangxiensis]
MARTILTVTSPRNPVGLPAPAQIPRLPTPNCLTVDESRDLSRVLFQRLWTLPEGSADYSYVRNTLVELNLALVRACVSHFRHRSEPTDDLMQVGIVGLIKAINRFDPGRGVEFATFALPTIDGELKRFFRDTSWAVQVPRRLQELRLKLARSHDTLQQQLGHEPSDPELAAHLGATVDDIAEARIATNAYTAGTLEPPIDAEGNDSPLSRQLGYTDYGLERVEACEALRPAIAALCERDRAVLSLRFTGELTQAQIGAELGISQMQVSRILTRVLDRLRAVLLAER